MEYLIVSAAGRWTVDGHEEFIPVSRYRLPMEEHVSVRGPDLLRRLTLPVASAVAIVVAIAWYVTWSSAGILMMATPSMLGATDLGVFFALIVVMMVAMMLPSALPMILAYRGITRLEDGRPTKSADFAGTLAFVIPYFLVWGLFGVAALLGLAAIGVPGSMWMGTALLVPAATLVVAGLWQVTRTKEVCLSHCTSPNGFIVRHWRSGRTGAMRMGLRHSVYCIGCCWLFMLVLFVAGAMNLAWMGGVSLLIFVEKLGLRPVLVSRAIGVLLIGLGAIVTVGALFAM